MPPIEPDFSKISSPLFAATSCAVGAFQVGNFGHGLACITEAIEVANHLVLTLPSSYTAFKIDDLVGMLRICVCLHRHEIIYNVLM